MSVTKSAKSNTAEPKLSLQSPLRFLKGIGPQRASYFARKGLITLHDAIYFFPRRYEDRRRIYKPKELVSTPEATQISVRVQIEDIRETPLRGRNQKMLTLKCRGEDGGYFSATWFNSYKGLAEKFPRGTWFVFSGPLKLYQGLPQIVHPDAEQSTGTGPVGKSLHFGRLVPIYSRTEGLTQRLIRDVEFNALEIALPLIQDLLPDNIRARHQLLSLQEALQEIHFPKEHIPDRTVLTAQELHPAIVRLIFEEFFKFQLVLRVDRSELKQEPGIAFTIKNHSARAARKNLNFKLTAGQEQAIAEILQDLQKANAMNRIVQGDVGSGKTLVALLTLAEAAENSCQGALLAPTEILAEQHYANAQKLFAGTAIKLGFLTGSLSKAEKQAAYAKIKSGEWQLIIGTHALIQEAVQWNKLSYVVIDEQHRFGVKQRSFLKDKAPPGLFPHILTMTATPIPRSLALTVFGELSVSTIPERPPGRQEIATKVLRGQERQKMYNLIKKEIEQGHQAYLIYPLVTDSDKEGMEKLRSVESEIETLRAGPLAGLKLEMVHGQMSPDERQERMKEFKEKKYDVLVATTVIEVGVDVANATVIGIEHAERFGLSQLHQLRGRVGRGEHKSYCVLMTDAPPPAVLAAIRQKSGSEDEGDDDEGSWQRLQVLEKSQDGFFIAEEDLKMRGPGDFLGTKQSGSPTFRLADLSRDLSILEKARQEANRIYELDPQMQLPEHSILKTYISAIFEEASRALKSG